MFLSFTFQGRQNFDDSMVIVGSTNKMDENVEKKATTQSMKVVDKKSRNFEQICSDREQGNFLAEEIVGTSLANTVGTGEKSNNGDATKDIDENQLERKTDDNNTWEDITSDISNFQSDTTQSGIEINEIENMSPITVFEQIWDQHITDFVVNSTNNYGRVLNQSNRPKTRHSRFREFKPICRKGVENVFRFMPSPRTNKISKN
ncbi:hypothetical protein QE152_g33559 [Popillia japonica]|uniref:Uncharacterized protein n=1 Tax=Popillia japonica TaxID=7064 RepID=A0AAW1IWF5_POPJA